MTELLGQDSPFAAIFPNVGDIFLLDNYANTSYSASQSTLERRFSNGLGISANFTWSHALDNFPQRMYPSGLQHVWENAGTDLRHRFLATANYQLPFGRNQTGIIGGLARGWQVNAILTLQTGFPFTVTDASGVSNTGTPYGDTPNIVGNPVLGHDQRSISRWFNTAAFVQQTAGTWGDAGFDDVYGPGLRNLDISILKNVQVTERIGMQFRWESFNVFNTPPLGNPNSQVGNPSYGVISSAGSPRNNQLVVKVQF